MKDSDMPIDASTGEAALSTELPERLLRRRTEPLGLIDVRQPQQHYTRTAGWVAQRFALLEHWKTRYGSDEDVAAANSSLVFAAPGQPIAEPSQVRASSAQLARAAQPVVASQPSPASVASSSPPAQLRVRRHGLPPTDGDTATPAMTHRAPATSSALILPKRRAGNVEAEQGAAAGSMRNVEGSSQPGGTALPAANTAQAPTADLTKNPDIAPHRSAMPSATAAGLTQTPVSVSHGGASSGSLPLRLQRQPDPASLGLARAQELTAPAVSGPIASMPLSQSLTSPLHEPSSLPGGGSPGSNITYTVAARTSQAGSETEPAHGESSASFPLVQRQSLSSAASADRAPGDVADRRSAVAAEIRTASSGMLSPVMIWRRHTEDASAGSALVDVPTGGTRSALPLAISAARGGEPQVARQATSAESASSTNTESTVPTAVTPMPGPSPANAPAHAIDIAQLAAQVDRLLSRQLVVERERRGRGR